MMIKMEEGDMLMNLDEIYSNISKAEKEILEITLETMGMQSKLNRLKTTYKNVCNLKEELLLVKIDEKNCLRLDDVRQKILEADLNIKIMMRESVGLDNSLYMYKLNKLVAGDNNEM